MTDQDSPQDSDDPSALNTSESEEPRTAESESDPSSESVDSPASPVDEAEESPSEKTTDRDELHFEDNDLGEKLRHASDEQRDTAPFGIIRIDDEGIVEFFNQYESELSGMAPEEAIGRNFFSQVAPCTNNRLFRGRFKKGIRRGELDETFTYTYTYKMRPTLVDVHLYRDEAGNNWITTQKY